MIKKYFKGKNDGMFKAVFCNPKNEDLLKALIEDGLKRKVKILKIFPPEIIKNNIYVKGKTLDVLVEADNEILNIEVNTNYYDGLHRRNASYIFSKYSEEAKIGDDYDKMRNFIQMNITSGLNKEEPLVSEYVLADLKTKKKFIDNLTIYEYNLDKIKELYSKTNEYKFLAALDCDEKELKKICRGDKIMEKFEHEVNELNKDIEFTQFLTEEEDARKVHNTLMNNAKKEGIEIGITKRNYQIAKDMLNDNIDIETIIKYTGLTKEEINSLLKE